MPLETTLLVRGDVLLRRVGQRQGDLARHVGEVLPVAAGLALHLDLRIVDEVRPAVELKDRRAETLHLGRRCDHARLAAVVREGRDVRLGTRTTCLAERVRACVVVRQVAGDLDLGEAVGSVALPFGREHRAVAPLEVPGELDEPASPCSRMSAAPTQ